MTSINKVKRKNRISKVSLSIALLIMKNFTSQTTDEKVIKSTSQPPYIIKDIVSAKSERTIGKIPYQMILPYKHNVDSIQCEFERYVL